MALFSWPLALPEAFQIGTIKPDYFAPASLLISLIDSKKAGAISYLALSRCYEAGCGIEQDAHKAYLLAKRCFELVSSGELDDVSVDYAVYFLGHCISRGYREGYQSPWSCVEGMKIVRQAAAKGVDHAITQTQKHEEKYRSQQILIRLGRHGRDYYNRGFLVRLCSEAYILLFDILPYKHLRLRPSLD